MNLFDDQDRSASSTPPRRWRIWPQARSEQLCTQGPTIERRDL